MERRIVGFHQDEERHWLADLECGHSQHVRHDPPWQLRPWVTTPEGRASWLGRPLQCRRCGGAPEPRWARHSTLSEIWPAPCRAWKGVVRPAIFFVTEHYREYPIVLVRLPRIGRRRLADVLEEAWRQVAPKRMRSAYDAQCKSGTGRPGA